ncbi:MAG: Ig-like domain-containing protein [Chloroflexi bacterium]|nr:Ig-like domain-containing protein [Chloroflexota bacterium]
MRRPFPKILIVLTILTLLLVRLPVSDASAAAKMTVYEHVAFDTGKLQLFPSNVQGFGVQTDTCSVMGVNGQASYNSSGVGYYQFYGTPKYIGSCTYSVKYDLNNIPDYTLTVEFTVSNTAEAPTAVVLSNKSVNENMASGTLVDFLSFTDPDIAEGYQSTTPSYQIVGGADASSFTLKSGWGVYSLITNASFNCEAGATREVIIRVIETSSLYADTTFNISILNVNENPIGLSLSPASVAENAAVNTVVGSLATSDPDIDDTFAYTLVTGTGSTDNASFNVYGSKLRTSAVFNYEADSSYSIRLRSTDSGGLTTEKALTVTVSNVNDAPVITSNGGGGGASVSVAENGTAVTTVTATDGDLPTPTLTYSISGGADSAKFSIASGVLTFKSAPNFDIPSDSGANNVYDVIVRVSDGTLTDTQAIAITVSNVNETPSDIALSSASVAENAAANTIVGALTSTDPDASNTFTYTLVTGTGSTDNTSFNISGASLRTSSIFNLNKT